MGKYIVGIMAFILVVAGGYYFWRAHAAVPTPVASTSTEATQTESATSTYATSTYSVVYPSSFTLDPNFENTSVNPQKPIDGVKFTIPATMATGTNLSSDSYVSIEQLPHAKKCTGDIFLAANVHSTNVTDNGVSYSVATSSDPAAGNLYEEAVYALGSSSPCTAVRYFIHSTNIGNYDPGTVQAYDRAALLAAFDGIRRAVQIR
jgi:hypothetical protein